MMPIQNTGADNNPLSLGSSPRADGQAGEEGGFGKTLKGEMESVRRGASENENKGAAQASARADKGKTAANTSAEAPAAHSPSANAETGEGLVATSDNGSPAVAADFKLLGEVTDTDAVVGVGHSSVGMDAEVGMADQLTDIGSEVGMADSLVGTGAEVIPFPIAAQAPVDTETQPGQGGKGLPDERSRLPLDLPASRRAETGTTLTSADEIDPDSEATAEDFLASLRRVRSEDAVSRPARESSSGSPRTEQSPIATAVAEATRKPVTLEEGLARLGSIRHADAPTSSAIPGWAPVGGASTAPASGTATPAALSVNVPVGQQGWDQALGERVAWMTRQGGAVQEAHIQLNPREMGPVEVRVSLNQDQASVSFAAQNPAARDALEAAMPRLREMLNESGLALADSQVSHQFPEQRQQAMDQRDDNGRGSGHDGGEDLARDGSDGETVMTTGTKAGMVDFYA